jgi:hypothetical protein
LRGVVEDRTNVIYARNLYPDEIARALVMAMGDDSLVDAITTVNLKLVSRLADRNDIARRVRDNYARRARQ